MLGGVLCNAGFSGVCTRVHACVFTFTHKHGQSLPPKADAVGTTCGEQWSENKHHVLDLSGNGLLE